MSFPIKEDYPDCEPRRIEHIVSLFTHCTFMPVTMKSKFRCHHWASSIFVARKLLAVISSIIELLEIAGKLMVLMVDVTETIVLFIERYMSYLLISKTEGRS